MNARLKRNISWMTVLFLFLSIIPLLWFSYYVYPSSDDYVFGAETYNTWINTHSIWDTLRSAAHVAAFMYNSWQGTYSACFLMALQPGVFDAYWVTPFILLFTFIASNFWLLYIILCKKMKADKSTYLIISSTVVLMNLQFVDSIRDMLYWYNGALYYTFYYSVGLLFAGCLIEAVSSKTWVKYVWGGISVLLAVFLAGGNFVMGFVAPFILGLTICIRKYNTKKIPVVLVVVLIVFCAGLLFSVLAPGNAVRQATVTTNKSLFGAGIKIVGEGFAMLIKTLPLTKMVLCLFLLPFINELAKRVSYRFPKPWLFLLMTYVIYSLFLFPTNYALGFNGDSRTTNLYTFNTTWFILLNMFYVLGYIHRNNTIIIRDLWKLWFDTKRSIAHRRFVYSYLSMTVLLLLCVTIFQKPASSRKVLDYIASGKADVFKEIMQNREKAYEGMEKNLLFTQPLPKSSHEFYFTDLSIDANFWINQGLCMYYQKKTISLRTPQSLADFYYRQNDMKKEVGPGNLRYKEQKEYISNIY